MLVILVEYYISSHWYSVAWDHEELYIPFNWPLLNPVQKFLYFPSFSEKYMYLIKPDMTKTIVSLLNVILSERIILVWITVIYLQLLIPINTVTSNLSDQAALPGHYNTPCYPRSLHKDSVSLITVSKLTGSHNGIHERYWNLSGQWGHTDNNVAILRAVLWSRIDGLMRHAEPNAQVFSVLNVDLYFLALISSPWIVTFLPQTI